MELCLGKVDEPDESVWFRIREPQTGVALWWVSAMDYLIRKKQMRPSSDAWEKPHTGSGEGFMNSSRFS